MFFQIPENEYSRSNSENPWNKMILWKIQLTSSTYWVVCNWTTKAFAKQIITFHACRCEKKYTTLAHIAHGARSPCALPRPAKLRPSGWNAKFFGGPRVTSLVSLYKMTCSFLWSHCWLYATFSHAAVLPSTCKHTTQIGGVFIQTH